METRENLQKEALDALRTDKRLILNWGTGVGKSRVAVNAMDAILTSTPDARFLLMVQETPHKDNWKEEIYKALGKRRADKVMPAITMDCYASFKKHESTSWDLIVFDEGHHLRSIIRQRILATMAAKRVLVLTATASDKNDGDQMLMTLENTFGEFRSMSFGLQEAIDNNLLKTPEIHLIPVVLDHKSQDKYDDMTEYLDRKSGEYHKMRSDFLMEAGESDNEDTEAARIKWLNAGAQRKRLLGACKTTVAKEILNGPLKDKKLICFCASVDQIAELGGKSYVCSRNTAKQNREAIEEFNRSRKKALYAMGMLQEGQNLKGIEAGLLIQLDGKARPFIQKFGRVMRSENPVLYIIYAKDTHDEEYVDNALTDIDRQYIVRHDPLLMNGKKAQTSAINPPTAPMKRPEGAETLIWTVDNNYGRLISVNGDTAGSISGFLTEIGMVDGRTPMYVLKIQETYGTRIHAVHVNRKLSIGLIASIASISRPGDKPILLNVYKNGYWTQYDVLYGRTKAKWDRRVMENYPDDNDQKVAYLDTIVEQINLKIQNQ